MFDPSSEYCQPQALFEKKVFDLMDVDVDVSEPSPQCHHLTIVKVAVLLESVKEFLGILNGSPALAERHAFLRLHS